MLFNRIIRNLFIVALLFIVGINIYVWSFEIQARGSDSGFEFVGFYRFYQHLATFPSFEFFILTLNELTGWLSDLKSLDLVLTIVTAGVYFIVRFLFYVGGMLAGVLTDVLMIIRWLLEFLGIQGLATIG